MGLHILIADDEPRYAVLTLELAQLEVDGLTGEVVENGEKLVERAKQRRFDAIITDNRMPAMNGLEAIPLLRTQGYTGPVYLYSNGYHHTEAIEAGATGFFRKGTDDNEIVQILQGLSLRKEGE